MILFLKIKIGNKRHGEQSFGTREYADSLPLIDFVRKSRKCTGELGAHRACTKFPANISKGLIIRLLKVPVQGVDIWYHRSYFVKKSGDIHMR